MSRVPSLRSLEYKGDGNYDAKLNGTVTLELSYDGSDHAVGDWTLWEIRIDGEPLGIRTDVLPNRYSSLLQWLEAEARKDGHLPEEPEVAA